MTWAVHSARLDFKLQKSKSGSRPKPKASRTGIATRKHKTHKNLAYFWSVLCLLCFFVAVFFLWRNRDTISRFGTVWFKFQM